MPIWRLSPIDLSDRNWEASSHRGQVVVRASNEDEARDLAEDAFAVKTRFAPGMGVITPPWKRPEQVKVELVTDSPYEPEGPPQVLEPSFEHDLKPHAPKKF